MGYKLLSSVFYQDKELYKDIYNGRLNSESAYVFDFDVKGRSAFVLIEPNILDKIDKIFDLNCKLNTITQSLPIEAQIQYAKRCLLDEIYLTNNIEGVYSTRSEINDILESKESPKKYIRFYALVKKYEAIINGITPTLNTCEDVRKMYDDFMLKDVVKENKHNAPDGIVFRKNPVYISGKHGNIVHHGMTPEEEIIESMNKAISVLNNEKYNDLIKIAVFHYMFGYVHPFYDGNGRLSRFISSSLLSKKLNYLVSCRLSCSVKNKLQEYYKAFNVCNDEKNMGDLTYFVLKFFDIVIDAEEDLFDGLSERKDKLIYYNKCLDNIVTDKKMNAVAKILMQNTLFGVSGLDINKLVHLSGMGITSVRTILKKMNTMGIISISNKGRTNLYDVNIDRLNE